MASPALYEEVDKLQTSGKWSEAYDLLKSHTESEDPELLWRLIRSYYRMGKYVMKDNKPVRDSMAKKGTELVNRAANKYPEHFEIRRVNSYVFG